MGFLDRVFRRSGPRPAVLDLGGSMMPDEPTDRSDVEAVSRPAEVVLQRCPYCAAVIDPPPARSRRCPSCRRPIVVRRIDGRSVLLTAEAVEIFVRERQRVAVELRWASERAAWLRSAATVNADPARIARLAQARLSADVVDDSKALYLAAAENEARKARVAKRWSDVSRIRRHQATALFDAAGRPIPPPADIVKVRRDAMIAELRALAKQYKGAEVVSSGCCRICRADNGQVFVIAAELRTPRLPHTGCSKGLCACDWWLAMPGPRKRRRARKTLVSVSTGVAP